MASLSPPPSGQTLDHTPALSPPSDLHHPPKSPEPHTSNMSSPQEESAPIADASALHITKPTRAGISFLSLPPEIRNMIYNYIFTPVKDGTCLAVHAPWDGHHLQGFRRVCNFCALKKEHDTCLARYRHEDQLSYAFDIPYNYVQPGILRTCRTILEEASPVLLAYVYISTHISLHGLDFLLRCLERLLAYMRQPEGAYLSKFTYRCLATTTESMKLLSKAINRGKIRIGHLVLLGRSSFDHSDLVKIFVANLDSLEHKPARVEWLDRWNEHHHSQGSREKNGFQRSCKEVAYEPGKDQDS